jgi:hypothetical protein
MDENEYKFCDVCGEPAWFGVRHSHVCPPIHKVYKDGSPEDADDFHASDPERAAEKWAEEYDKYEEGQYGIAAGHDAVVVVIDPEGVSHKFRVSGEYNPSYWVNEVGQEPQP